MASSNPHHHHHHHDLPASSAPASSSSVSVPAPASTAAPPASETGGGAGRGGVPSQPLSPPAYGYTSSSSTIATPQGPRQGQGQGSALPNSGITAATGLPTTSSMSGPASGPASVSGSAPRSTSGIVAGNNGNPPPPPAFRGSSYASVVSGGAEPGGIAPPQNLQRPSRYVSQFSTASTSYPLSTAAAAAAATAAATTSRATTTGMPAYLMYPPMSSHTRNTSRVNTGDSDGLGFGNSGVAGGRDGSGRGDGGSGNNSTSYVWNRWSGQVPSHAGQYAGVSNGNEGHLTAAGSSGPAVATASVSMATASPAAPRFFVPSYLRGSRHIERLEEARRARLLAQQRESRVSAGINTHQPHHNGGSLSTSSSNVSLHKLTTPSLPASSITATGSHSHRGLAYEVVERVPGSAVGGNNIAGSTAGNISQQQSHQTEETLAPLPSRWSETDRFSGLDVLAGGWQVRFTSNKTGTHDEAAAVRADHPMPRQCGIYYYEVTVMSKGKEGLIGIGFSGPKVPLNRLPGWEPESWAYHGDDGYSFCCTASGKPYGPKFASLDVIGCGVNFRTGCAFFTKNGVHLGTAFKDIKSDRLYPSVGMKKQGEHLRVNFGQMPFVYDIDGMLEREKQYLQAEVNKANVASLNPPLDETRLIQELVAQYLAHEGYVETARAFAGEMNENSIALAKGTDKPAKELGSTEDVDAMNRQEIRASILDGDIDKALKLTTTYYPSVLRENENIYFKLRCHKFIEMIRSCIELHSEITGTGSRSSRRRRHRQKVAGRLGHMKNQKERGRGKKGLGHVHREYGVEHENGLGRNGDTNGEGNRGTNADEFAQDMELDNENGRTADCYNYRDNDGTEAIADASNGSRNGNGNSNSISVIANWDRMDMEDGESGDDGAGHGVSIVSATNGSSQKINNKKREDSNGLVEDDAGIDNDEDEDEGEEEEEEEEEEEISDSTMSSNSDSNSDSADYDDQEMDDEVNDHDDSQHRNAEEATLQEKYNVMMQLTIQYGQELKSEFDGDPRREVKQVLEETFALIAYPDARESMLAPLLDVSERIPVAEELNGAILVSLGKSSAAALENLYQQTVVLVNDLAEDGGPGALIHVGNDFMACP